jgi:phage major head subunit gpT-like protein
LTPGLRKIFFDEYKQWPEEFSQIATVETSDRAYEEEQAMTGLGRLVQKSESRSISYDLGVMGGKQRYTHVEYALGFRISRKLLDDDQYGVMKKMSKQLAVSAKQTVELEFGLFLDDIFTGATYKTIDAHPLCYTAQPLLIGGTYCNMASTPADLGVGSLRAAGERIERLVNERGLPLMMKPTTLLVSPTYQWVAAEILKSTGAPYTNENQPNVTQSILGLNYIVNHFMSDTDQWNLLAPKGQHDIKFFWRQKPVFESSDDFDTKDAKFSVTCRFSLGFTDWRGVDGSSGAA